LIVMVVPGGPKAGLTLVMTGESAVTGVGVTPH
jgi:hypothetical protein